jgi:hypothetical protein
MLSRRTFLGGLAGATVGLWVRLSYSQETKTYGGSQLAESFAHPPESARPWVYWFWANGNVTKEGITADLEAMQRVGIGGVLIMDVDPAVPPGPVAFASTQWREIFHFTCAEANRLGLEVNLYNAAGWAGSGGPWITPELSMQKVVWSETAVEGPRHFAEALPNPEAVAGYYQDIAVLAFPAPSDDSYRIHDIQFKATFETKSVPYDTEFGLPPLPISFPSLPSASRIEQTQIRDLTPAFENGRLAWEVPDGKWTVLRFGHTSTGVDNHPTPKAGRGLECDKLSREAIELHFSKFLGKVISDAGPLAGKTLVSTHIDSWESGAQNWTAKFRDEFQKRCGYDIVPFLPVMTGRAVSDLEISERFLWDLRKTISDLLIENYAGGLRELAHQHGLRLTIEAYDGDPCDEMGYAARADEPQGEFWLGRDYFPQVYRSWQWFANMVSAAHVYGKKIIAAESFTSMPGEDWLAHPATLKPLGDWALCAGINRLVFHRYAMQPWMDRAPGMTMGPFGVHYERTQTWWEESKGWHEYLTRSQFMLRQGLFVADICYLQPEGAPMRFRPPGVDMHSADPPTAPGYNFDGCTPEVVLTRMAVKDGRIVLPDGMSYRLLVLPEPGDMPGAGTMTPQLLGKIAELVNEGMILVGPRPTRSPSLSGYPACDQKLEKIADQLWGDCDGLNVTEHRYGKGRVIWGQTPQQALQAMGVPPDFSSGRQSSFRYIHRRTEDGTDIYFLANKKSVPVEEVCSFRGDGRRPEFWWPETGRIERPALYEESNGCIRLPIRLAESGSVFVVFSSNSAVETDRITLVMHNGEALTEAGGHIQIMRGPDNSHESLIWRPGWYSLLTAGGKQRNLKVPALPEPVAITGPWDVRFAPDWGAPARVEFPKLISWTEHADPGIRYFSGRATYRKEIQIPPSMPAKGYRVWLDLGEVQVIASVRLNGQPLGDLWKPPFRLDITDAAHAGASSLELVVVNLWPNRLIGDANLPEDCEWEESPFGGTKLKKWPAWLLEGKPSPTGRFTFTTCRPWPKDAELLKSGLLGPVMLYVAAEITFRS